MGKKIIIVLAFLFAILTFLIGQYPVFPKVYNTMNVIVDSSIYSPKDIILKINDDYFSIPSSKNILNKAIKGKVDSLDILVDKNFKNKIKNIVIFNDIKIHYFKDFSKFEKSETELCPAGVCSIYDVYKVPESVKYSNFKSYNFHSIQNLICLLGLSICWLFLAFKINRKILTPLVFIFGALMYSNGLFDYLPWTDEYRTIEYSAPDKNLLNVFQDPGNPALFYILFRIFITFFGVSTVTMKVFPFLIAMAMVFLLWKLLYKRYGLKTANLGSFLAFINVPLVYYAQETRSYILQALFTLILTYYLFKILEEKKGYIAYGVLVALLSNLHYYEILLLFSNFVYAIFYFVREKNYKEIGKFALANAAGGAFFLPYFIFVAYKNALVDPTFNNWIPPICYMQIKKCVLYLFGGSVSFLLSSVFCFINKDKFTRYLFFAIVFTTFQGILLSYLIRPMLVERYLILLSPLFIMYLAVIFTSKYSKNLIALFMVWAFFIQIQSFEKNNRRKGIIEGPLSFSWQFVEQENPKENVYAIINLSNPEYLENKDKLIKKEINYVSRSVFAIEETIDEILKKDKNAVILTSTLNSDEKNSKNNYTCYFNSSTDMCIWKIKN